MDKENKRKLKKVWMGYLVAFVLALSWIGVGIALALSNARISMGGTIGYDVEDVAVTVSDATFTNFKSGTSGKCKGFSVDASSSSTKTNTWSGLNNLTLLDSGATATIEYTITNDSQDNQNLSVKFSDLPKLTGTNCNMTISVTNGTASAVNLTAGRTFTVGYTASTKVLKVKITFAITDTTKGASIDFSYLTTITKA